MSGIVSYLGRSITVAWVTSLLGSNPVHAQSASFIRDCQKWIDKKGYSTDYIEQKTGKRQSGLASSWRGNVRVQGVQPGDVVLVRLRVPGAMHAAFVEEVRRNAAGAVSTIRLSEWNWGRMINQRCLVTETFGQLSSGRWINLDDVAQVWRTSLPLQE